MLSQINLLKIETNDLIPNLKDCFEVIDIDKEWLVCGDDEVEVEKFECSIKTILNINCTKKIP